MFFRYKNNSEKNIQQIKSYINNDKQQDLNREVDHVEQKDDPRKQAQYHEPVPTTYSYSLCTYRHHYVKGRWQNIV